MESLPDSGKFRNKEIVDAYKVKDDFIDANGIINAPEWVIKAFKDGVIFYELSSSDRGSLFIGPYEYKTKINVEDYIIRDSEGRIFTMCPYSFTQIYEPIH